MRTKTDLHNIAAEYIDTLRDLAKLNSEIATTLNRVAEAMGIAPQELQILLAAIEACHPRLQLTRGGNA